MIHTIARLLLLAAVALAAGCHAPPDPAVTVPDHQATASACDDGNPCTAARVLPDLPVFALQARPALLELSATPVQASQAAPVADHTERNLEMVGAGTNHASQLRTPLLEHRLIIGRLRADRAAVRGMVAALRTSPATRSIVWLC